MVPLNRHLQVGSLLFEGLDQIDLTGPFEVLSRLPNSTYRIFAKTTEPMRDTRGLWLKPDATLADARQLDVLHVPGGFGQEAMMDDDAVFGLGEEPGSRRAVRLLGLHGRSDLRRGRSAQGAPGDDTLGRISMLPFFGAIPANDRVVVDGNMVFAAGVTAGIDGALRVAAELRGVEAAQTIQLYMQYAPEPPFDSGTPETAPRAIHETARQAVKAVTEQREITARRMAARLGIKLPLATTKEAVEIRTRPNEE